MKFIILARWRKKPTKEIVDAHNKLIQKAVKDGVKIAGGYWTLGRYDAVYIAEGPDTKTTMKALFRFAELLSTETLVAEEIDTVPMPD